MAQTSMDFSADASAVLAEVRKLAEQNKVLTDSLNQASKAAQQGAQIATEAYKQQNAEARKLIDQNDKLKEKIEDLKEKMKKTGSEGSNAFAGIGTALSGKVYDGIMRVIDAGRQFNEQLKQMAVQADQVGRRLQVQGLIGDKEFQESIKPRVGQAAQAAGVSLQEAQQVATELISQGFDKDTATGDVLKELLLGAQGTNAQDKVALATSTAAFIKGSGQELNATNVREAMAANAALYQKTAFQSQDAIQLAQAGSLFKELGIDINTGRAAFTVLKDVGGNPAEKSQVALRNIATILSGARGDKEKSDILQKIGGKELLERTDLVGESLPQALAALNEKLSELDEGSRNAAVSKLFGREVAAPAMTLLNNMDKLQEFIDVQKDRSILAQGVETATQGENVMFTRLQNQKELDLIKKARVAAQQQAFIEAQDTELASQGYSSAYRGAQYYVNQAQAAVGWDPEEFQRTFDTDEKSVEIREKTRKRLRAAQGPTKLEDRALPEINTPKFDTRKMGRGGNKKLFFDDEYKTPEQQRVQDLQIQMHEAQLEASRAKDQAEDARLQRGGKKITAAEQKQIDKLEHIAELLERQVEQQQLQIELDKQKQRRSNAGL